MEIKMTVESNYQSDAGGGGFYHERPEAQEIELSDERAFFEAGWFMATVGVGLPGLVYKPELESFVIEGMIDDVRQFTLVDSATVRGWILVYLMRELRIIPSPEFVGKVYDYAIMRGVVGQVRNDQLYREFFNKPVGTSAIGDILGPGVIHDMSQRMNFDFFSDKRIGEDHPLYSKLHP